jgi:protein gp37
MNNQFNLLDGKVVVKPGSVEWTCIIERDGTVRPGYTWNVIPGCLHGCRWIMPDGTEAQCYAERTALGIAKGAYPNGFAHADYFFEDRLLEPAKVKTPAGIFLDSMGDLFGSWNYADAKHRKQLLRVLEVVRDNPRHIFQSLTKNPAGYLHMREHLPDNMWVGVSMPPTIFRGDTAHPNRMTPVTQGRWLISAVDMLRSIYVPVKWMSLEPLSFDVVPLFQRTGTPFRWVVIGAATKGRETFQPDPIWVQRALDFFDARHIPVFFKGNLEWPANEWRSAFPV